MCKLQYQPVRPVLHWTCSGFTEVEMLVDRMHQTDNINDRQTVEHGICMVAGGAIGRVSDL